MKSADGSKGYGRIAKTGVLWNYGIALTELLNIPTTMVLARVLTPAEFGIVAAASFFVRFASRLMNFGFNQALVRLKTATPEHYSSVFVVNLAIGAALWGAFALAAPWLAAAFRIPEAAPVIPVAALGFVIDAIGSVPQAAMVRELRFWQGTVSGWISALVVSGTGITLALNGFGFWSLVYASLAGTAAQTLALTWLTGWRPRLRFSRSAMRELFSFGMGVHSKRLLDYAAANLDNVVVARLLGPAALGLYDKAFTLMDRAVIRLNLAATGVSFRIFALIHEEPERFRRAYCRVIMTGTLISLPPLTAGVITAPELIGTLFGEAWAPAVLPFQILCGVGVLRLLNQYASSATQAIGWVWPEVWRQAIYAGMIVAAVALLSPWGLAGAAAGVLIATATMTVLMHAMLIRATGLTLGGLLRAQRTSWACSAGLAVVLLGARLLVRTYVLDPAAWQLLAIDVAVSATFYGGFVLFAPFEEMRELVDETLSEFAPRLARLVRARAGLNL